MGMCAPNMITHAHTSLIRNV